MPQSIDELVALLDLETIEDGLFRGRQPETSLQRVFGGQVASQALVAGVRTVEPDREVHSLHAYFLRPGDTAVPIVYDVERTRDGRSFSTRRVVGRQHGKPIFYLSASFQVPEEGLEHQDPMPAAPDPETLPSLRERMEDRRDGVSPEEWSALDVRYAVPEGDGPLDLQVWLRTDGDMPESPLLHAATLAYASDLTLLASAAITHRLRMDDPRLVTASIDHAMWFHRPVRVDSWLLHDQESPSASGGRGIGRGRVFATDGSLVATTVQEGLLRLRQELG